MWAAVHFGECLESSFWSCFDPAKAAVAAAVMAAVAAPNFAPPAAFIAPAILANAAIPPTSTARKATVGFIAMFLVLGLSAVSTVAILRDAHYELIEKWVSTSAQVHGTALGIQVACL